MLQRQKISLFKGLDAALSENEPFEGVKAAPATEAFLQSILLILPG